MQKSRAYRVTDVKRVCFDGVVAGRDGVPAYVGLDVGKETILSSLRWGQGDFERPWRVNSPLEIGELVALLVRLNEGRRLVVALEPTGTYGDPLRQALADAGLTAHRVSPKASHDYAEIFDGVPSQHDGKDAAIVAELAALGKSSEWEFSHSDWEQELAYWVDRRDAERRQSAVWFGRLEGLLARHWPEATRILPLSGGVLLRCLAEYVYPLVCDRPDDRWFGHGIFRVHWHEGSLRWSRAAVASARRDCVLCGRGSADCGKVAWLRKRRECISSI